MATPSILLLSIGQGKSCDPEKVRSQGLGSEFSDEVLQGCEEPKPTYNVLVFREWCLPCHFLCFNPIFEIYHFTSFYFILRKVYIVLKTFQLNCGNKKNPLILYECKLLYEDSQIRCVTKGLV